MSNASERFREFVRQHRAALPRKQRRDSSVYWISSIRQVVEQVNLEVRAGIAHDPAEVEGIVRLARETIVASKAPAAKKPGRFRGVGR